MVIAHHAGFIDGHEVERGKCLRLPSTSFGNAASRV